MPRKGRIASSALRYTHSTNAASGLAPNRRRKKASVRLIAVSRTMA